MIFLNDKVTKRRADVHYAAIKQVVLCKHHKEIIRFHFNHLRPPGFPSKMNLFTQARRDLCDYLKIAWKTDFMFRKDRFGKFPLYQTVTSDEVKKASLKHFSTIPSKMTNPPEKYLKNSVNICKMEYKGYFFFIPEAFIPDQQQGIYVDSDKKYYLQI